MYSISVIGSHDIIVEGLRSAKDVKTYAIAQNLHLPFYEVTCECHPGSINLDDFITFIEWGLLHPKM